MFKCLAKNHRNARYTQCSNISAETGFRGQETFALRQGRSLAFAQYYPTKIVHDLHASGGTIQKEGKILYPWTFFPVATTQENWRVSCVESPNDNFRRESRCGHVRGSKKTRVNVCFFFFYESRSLFYLEIARSSRDYQDQWWAIYMVYRLCSITKIKWWRIEYVNEISLYESIVSKWIDSMFYDHSYHYSHGLLAFRFATAAKKRSLITDLKDPWHFWLRRHRGRGLQNETHEKIRVGAKHREGPGLEVLG